MTKKKVKDVLETQEFHDLCSAYRHMPLCNQERVIECFEDIKNFIRENFVPK